MTATALEKFFDGAGSRPYRELIKHHIDKQSVEQLMLGSLGILEKLPENVRGAAETYLDACNGRMLIDPAFWQTATCEQAFMLVIKIAIDALPISEWIQTPTEALEVSNHELAFDLFQIPTLNPCGFIPRSLLREVVWLLLC